MGQRTRVKVETEFDLEVEHLPLPAGMGKPWRLVIYRASSGYIWDVISFNSIVDLQSYAKATFGTLVKGGG